MLERLRPEIIEQNIGHIDLTDLNHAHGDNPDEDKARHVTAEAQKSGQESDREKAHHWPEKDLKKAEDVPFRDDPILEDKGPCLNQYSLQIG